MSREELIALLAERDARLAARAEQIAAQARRIEELERASQTDAEWLRATLERTSRRFGLHVAARSDDLLEVASLDSDTHPRMTPAGVGG